MNIYVGNLSPETTEARLREHFEAFGQVTSAKIIMDRDSGISRGFGFVEMPDEAEAKKAVEELNGKELDGQQITANEAKPRKDSRYGGGNSSSLRSEMALRAQVVVNNDVDKALRILKRKLSEDGDHRRLRERKHFTPRSQRKRKKAVRAERKRQR